MKILTEALMKMERWTEIMFGVGHCNCGKQYIFDPKLGVKLDLSRQSLHRCGVSIEDNEISQAFDFLAETVYNLTMALKGNGNGE